MEEGQNKSIAKKAADGVKSILGIKDLNNPEPEETRQIKPIGPFEVNHEEEEDVRLSFVTTVEEQFHVETQKQYQVLTLGLYAMRDAMANTGTGESKLNYIDSEIEKLELKSDLLKDGSEIEDSEQTKLFNKGLDVAVDILKNNCGSVTVDKAVELRAKLRN